MTMDRMRGIYTDILNDYPTISMSMSLDDMVRSSYNVITYSQEGGSLQVGTIDYDDFLTIRIKHCDLGKSVGYNNYYPHLRDGIRQLKIVFESDSFIHYQIQDDPQLGFLLLPILINIAKHSDPFFGFYCDSTDLAMVNDIPGNSNLDNLIALFSRHYVVWGSLFFDKELASRIGFDLLKRWAEMITYVDSKSCFIERSGIPLRGGIQEEDDSIYRSKNDIFGHEILPKIIERLRLEYGL